MFTIDGLTWDVPCEITRAAEITASDISGMLLDRSYFNDVLGTFMRYDVSLSAAFLKSARYAQIYEALTDPRDGHSFVLPYNNGTIEITGRVERVTDVYVLLPGGASYWKETRFAILANHPSKTLSLAQAVHRGRAPLPEITSVYVGDNYTYTEDGWMQMNYGDGDATSY